MPHAEVDVVDDAHLGRVAGPHGSEERECRGRPRSMPSPGPRRPRRSSRTARSGRPRRRPPRRRTRTPVPLDLGGRPGHPSGASGRPRARRPPDGRRTGGRRGPPTPRRRDRRGPGTRARGRAGCPSGRRRSAMARWTAARSRSEGRGCWTSAVRPRRAVHALRSHRRLPNLRTPVDARSTPPVCDRAGPGAGHPDVQRGGAHRALAGDHRGVAPRRRRPRAGAGRRRQHRPDGGGRRRGRRPPRAPRPGARAGAPTRARVRPSGPGCWPRPPASGSSSTPTSRVEIKDLLRCFEIARAGGADVAYGTRAHPESRLPASAAAPPRAERPDLQPPAAPARAHRRARHPVRDEGLHGRGRRGGLRPAATNGFGFDVEALARAERGGWRVEPVPVTWSHVEASRVRPLRDGVAMGVGALRHPAGSAGRSDGPTAARARRSRWRTTPSTRWRRVEREHWWFRAKRALVADAAARPGHRAGLVLDVGCGTGGLLEELGRARPAVGAELDRAARWPAPRRTSTAIASRAGAAEDVPVRAGAAGGRHRARRGGAPRRRRRRAPRARARRPAAVWCVVAVPAYAWAWSDHDVRLGHRRRYTRRSLREAAVRRRPRRAPGHVLPQLARAAGAAPPTHPAAADGAGRAEEASFVSPTVNRLLVARHPVERLGPPTGRPPRGPVDPAGGRAALVRSASVGSSGAWPGARDHPDRR